jgi:DUF1365 family protein
VNSCIYRGTVRHRRHGPVPHEFTYPLFMLYLELSELPDVFAERWLWSTRAPAPAWFRRADYLGDRNVSLSEAVRAEAERLTGRRPEGAIRMLTHLRYLGLVMNPVTFYYCFAPDGVRVDTILAEITNTPWKERHVYALSPQGSDDTPTDGPHRFTKAFHVSPFMPMTQDYVWRFSTPGRGLAVHMENHENHARVFDATLTMRREEITAGSLARTLMRFPWMTARVAAGIYWQALRLRLKRTPYHEHPARLAA